MNVNELDAIRTAFWTPSKEELDQIALADELKVLGQFKESFKTYGATTCIKVAGLGNGKLYIPKGYDFLGDSLQTWQKINSIAMEAIDLSRKKRMGINDLTDLKDNIEYVSIRYQSDQKLYDIYGETIKLLEEAIGTNAPRLQPVGNPTPLMPGLPTMKSGIALLANFTGYGKNAASVKDKFSGLTDEKKLETITMVLNGQGATDPRPTSRVWTEYMSFLKSEAGKGILESNACCLSAGGYIDGAYEEIKDHIKETDENTALLHFPIGIDGHYMGIVADLKNKSFEFYDAQAIHPKMRNIAPNVTLDGFLKEVSAIIFPGETIAVKYSVQPHQEDRHSCIFYVCDFVERRVKGETFENIISHGKEYNAISAARELMAENLYKFYLNRD